jgi:hypothetical protein
MSKASHQRGSKKQGINDKRLVAILELFPRDELNYHLGIYDERHPPKGFMVEFDPDVDPPTLTSKIVTTRVNDSLYGLELQLTNSGSENVNAKVWEL